MAVTLRLARYGVRGNAFYRIVATPKDAKRNGKSIEVLGTFNPMVNPPKVVLKEDRVKYWVENGAVPSSVVKDLLRKSLPGYIEGRTDAQLKKIQAARKARKARSKGTSSAKTAKKAKAKK